MRALKRILVTGAGGFIGHHLVTFLKSKGCWVRGVDLKNSEFATTQADEFLLADLRDFTKALIATRDVDDVYALAADMGGMGYISNHHALIMHGNSLIDLNTIEAARRNQVKRYFYPSSACIYPEFKQVDSDVTPLKEDDAYPAQPQDGYGWEKLLSEQLCEHYANDYSMNTRVVRLHNIFGPLCTWDGGREKAPAAICRKVAVAKLTGQEAMEIWGDGEQTRSFCYIDDCLEGFWRLMTSTHRSPVNLGQDRLVAINQLVDIVCEIAGVRLKKIYVPGPQGVRGRNSDNSKLREVLGWEPQISLEDGLVRTYGWIEDQVRQRLSATTTSALGRANFV
jgi:GDP-D-mannose 3', 5'-epimerase